MLINSKKNLRKHFIDLRNGFDAEYRVSADFSIASRLFEMNEFIQSETILIYVSVENEVDTHRIIENSFSIGKKVAVPFCKNNEMHFYYINSFEDLVCKQFGIPTVDTEKSNEVTDFTKALCVVPALSFDKNGNRLGYGGGYYDRFLADKHIESVGLCRTKQMSTFLPAEDFDVKIKKIILENKIVKTQEVLR